MKHLLRSVIDVDGRIRRDELFRNYAYLAQSDVALTTDEDRTIWAFVREYATQMAACPSLATVQDYLERHGDATGLDRLGEIAAYARIYQMEDYENLVNLEVENQKDQEMHVILKGAAQALTDGLTIKKGKETKDYRGHRGAMQYIMERAEPLMADKSGFKTKADIVEDTVDAREEFDRALTANRKTWGIITGLRDIDHVCRGIKPGEMWIHAAYTGQLKTTLALNWVYRAAFLLQYNVYYLSLEMPVDQIRRILYVMHSQHPKFRDKGFPPLTYRLVRDGEDEEGNRITQAQVDFYHHIIDDIEQNRDQSYGAIVVRSPDHDMTVPLLRQDMEVTHQKTPLHMAVVDHFALMKADSSTKNYYTDLNGIIRDTKRLALTFNQGERIPILGLLQINRQGNLEADKNDGVYKLQALADANEAERSADVVTTTYLNPELKAQGVTKFCCLKNRDNQQFLPFLANVDWNTRAIFNDFVTVEGSDHKILGAKSAADIEALMNESLAAGVA